MPIIVRNDPVRHIMELASRAGQGEADAAGHRAHAQANRDAYNMRSREIDAALAADQLSIDAAERDADREIDVLRITAEAAGRQESQDQQTERSRYSVDQATRRTLYSSDQATRRTLETQTGLAAREHSRRAATAEAEAARHNRARELLAEKHRLQLELEEQRSAWKRTDQELEAEADRRAQQETLNRVQADPKLAADPDLQRYVIASIYAGRGVTRPRGEAAYTGADSSAVAKTAAALSDAGALGELPSLYTSEMDDGEGGAIISIDNIARVQTFNGLRVAMTNMDDDSLLAIAQGQHFALSRFEEEDAALIRAMAQQLLAARQAQGADAGGDAAMFSDEQLNAIIDGAAGTGAVDAPTLGGPYGPPAPASTGPRSFGHFGNDVRR